MNTNDSLSADIQNDSKACFEKIFVVYATNPAIAYASSLETSESVICAGFETSDLNALMSILTGGMNTTIKDVMPGEVNVWFIITVFELKSNEAPSARSILRYFDHVYSPPRVMSIRYRGDYACLARAECDRLLSLKWREKPTIFTICSKEIVTHPLYDHLPDDGEVDYFNDNIVIKNLIDNQCEEYFKENGIPACQQF